MARLSRLEQLHTLPEVDDFSTLPSFFANRTAPGKPQVGSGPNSTNVIYPVATRPEAKSYNVRDSIRYAAEREQCWPFKDAPGATIELATREGRNFAGQDDKLYNSWGLPSELFARLTLANRKNSPVLIVLDRGSLVVPDIKTSLN